MAFQLPKLTTDVDCEPIGYPGLLVTFWLNITPQPWEEPPHPEEWERPFYFGVARMIERVTFPPSCTDSGQAEVVEIPDAKAIYDLFNAPGFDQQIIIWAQSQYQDQRQARLQASVKN